MYLNAVAIDNCNEHFNNGDNYFNRMNFKLCVVCMLSDSNNYDAFHPKHSIQRNLISVKDFSSFGVDKKKCLNALHF